MSSLDVILPTSKLNDWNFIHRVLLTVKLDVVQMLAKKNNKNFENLVKEFIPELENYEDEELFKKYNISSKIFGYEKEMPIKKTKSSANPVKEIISFNTQVNSIVSESKTEPIELKPTIKKKIIIKKIEPEINNLSINNESINNESINNESKNNLVNSESLEINNLSIDDSKKVKPIKITIKKINKKVEDNTSVIKNEIEIKQANLDVNLSNDTIIKVAEDNINGNKPMEIDTNNPLDNIGAPKKIKIKVKNVNP